MLLYAPCRRHRSGPQDRETNVLTPHHLLNLLELELELKLKLSMSDICCRSKEKSTCTAEVLEASLPVSVNATCYCRLYRPAAR